MLISTLVTSLIAALTSLSTESAPSPQGQALPGKNINADWFGSLPPTGVDHMLQGSMVSACTFAVGPPGPDLALCPAFLQYCHAYKESKSPDARALKTRPLRPSASSPLDKIHFRAGCAGGSSLASDGTYISGYTASCVVDGTEWVSLVSTSRKLPREQIRLTSLFRCSMILFEHNSPAMADKIQRFTTLSSDVRSQHTPCEPHRKKC